MILGLIVVVGVGSSHAALHPAGSDLYAEIPDAGIAIKAYSNAPFMRMIGSEGATNLGALVKDLGFDIQNLLGSLLPVADPTRPEDRWWPWSAAQKISFSASGLEASPKSESTISAWMICDFKSVEAATQAELALAAMGGTEATPSTPITLAGVEIPVRTIGSPLGVVPGTAWTARIDTRLVAGIGAAKPDDFVARSNAPEGGLHSTWNATEVSTTRQATCRTPVEMTAVLGINGNLPHESGAAGLAGCRSAPSTPRMRAETREPGCSTLLAPCR